MQDLLTLLEEQKDLLYPEMYKKIKDNYGNLTEEAKTVIFIQLQNASALKKIIDEYNSQRIAAVEEAGKELESIKNGCLKVYKEINQNAESEENKSDQIAAEQELNNL